MVLRLKITEIMVCRIFLLMMSLGPSHCQAMLAQGRLETQTSCCSAAKISHRKATKIP